MNKRPIVAIFLVTTMLILPIGACTSSSGPAMTNPPAVTSTTPPQTTVTSTANGRNIFMNGASSSGDPILQSNGPGGTYNSCGSCHGQDGHGGKIYPKGQTYDVPSIAWPVLTGQYPDHPSYTVDSVKRAITQGMDPAGKQMEYPMPVWTLSDRDLNDLVAFLQTLR